MSQTTNGTAQADKTTRFLYDGDALVGEYDGNNNLLRRYVHGPKFHRRRVDEPLVWYEGAGVGAANRRWFLANHQGSIIAVADSGGTVTNVLTYDAYGIPGGIVGGKFNAFSLQRMLKTYNNMMIGMGMPTIQRMQPLPMR